MQSLQHLISRIFSKPSAAIAVEDALKNKGLPEAKMPIPYRYALKPPIVIHLFENMLPLAGTGPARGILLASLGGLYQWVRVRISKAHIKPSVLPYSTEETCIVAEAMEHKSTSVAISSP